MSTKKLIMSKAHFHSIPHMVRSSLQNPITQPNTPFLPKAPSILATNLMKSYLDQGLVKDARLVFDEMPHRDVVAWTAMVEGYTSCNHHTQSWVLFSEMVKNEVTPNAFTFTSVFKACKGMKSLSCGALVHGLAIKLGMEGSIYVENAVMDMYATCCATMDDACQVFRDLCVKNAVSWTTLITGFTHRGDGYMGLRVFQQMLQEDAELNPFSFSIAVRACASIGSRTSGRQIQAAVIKCGFESNLAVMNSILDMYCRFTCLPEANQCFLEMSEKNLITWNTLIAGYQRIDSSECLYLFSQMESQGFSPNCFTFSSVAAGCADLAVLACGQQVHGGIFRRGFNQNLEVTNALIDMYAKCGNIADSRKVFDEMCDKNLVSWTSMMIGYGSHGFGKEAVELFDEMVTSGIRPDQIVFMAVLSACSHAGLVEEGLRYFHTMTSDYNVTPDQEIYGCVVDLLGRSGRVAEAYELIQNMPIKPNESVWGALLGACKAHKLPHLGKLAATEILDLKPNTVEAYVLLSIIYAADGKWREYAKTMNLIRGMGNKKEAGRSWIEVRNQVYSFVVGDKIGSHTKRVYAILELLIQQMRETEYEPNLDCLIHDLQDGT
ncbi:putative pentatricopeptide repeat-containing protein At1g56570 isoform X2 [Cannabis sativa]|uniref:putative pentatricopeptide repeat-containing protein At1g56570 isoform X2 n=1 Tax=Cannabis sativa TaxID=3483 RepID=UPI0029CA1FA6|nr:putative pentatricopeptide repeat-containing protein At1g56570 isoform X2 [Cannabis sativa]